MTKLNGKVAVYTLTGEYLYVLDADSSLYALVAPYDPVERTYDRRNAFRVQYSLLEVVSL